MIPTQKAHCPQKELSWAKINCDCLSFLTVKRSWGKPQPQNPGTAWMLLQGKVVVSSRRANIHLSLQVLTNDSLPSSGKYLTLCGKSQGAWTQRRMVKMMKCRYWSLLQHEPIPAAWRFKPSWCHALPPRATQSARWLAWFKDTD